MCMFLLLACNRSDGIIASPTLEHYSQQEHIGWSQSDANFQAKNTDSITTVAHLPS